MPGRYILLPALARAAFELADEATLAAVAAAAQQEAEKAGLPVRDAVADQCRGLMTGDPGLVLAAADYFGAAGRTLDHGSRSRTPRCWPPAAVIRPRLGTRWRAAVAPMRCLAPNGISIARARGCGHTESGAGGPRYTERPVSGWAALTPTESEGRRPGGGRAIESRYRGRAVLVAEYGADPRLAHPDQAGRAVTGRNRRRGAAGTRRG